MARLGLRSAGAALHFRDFRLLWAGRFASSIGAQVQTVALAWLVYDLTGSAAQLGGIGLARAIPIMALSLFGGALADQVDRRRLLLISQSFLALLSGALALAVSLDLTTVPMLYAFAVVTAGASAIDGPARQALIPSLVPREILPNALTLNILTSNTASVLGPAVGGVVLGAFGAQACFWLDAATFGLVVIALLLMRARPVVEALPRRGLAAAIDGLHFVREHGILWQLMVVDFLATLLVSTTGLLPVFAEDVLNVGPQGLGLLYAAPSAGSFIGAAAYAMRPVAHRPGRMVVLSVSGYGLMLAGFGLAPTFGIALVFLALAGAMDSISMATRHVTMQLASPDAFRGRVSAFSSIFSAGGPRLGQFQSGLTASLVGPQVAMVGGGLACVLMAASAPLWGRDLWDYAGLDAPPPEDELVASTETRPAPSPSK